MRLKKNVDKYRVKDVTQIEWLDVIIGQRGYAVKMIRFEDFPDAVIQWAKRHPGLTRHDDRVPEFATYSPENGVLRLHPTPTKAWKLRVIGLRRVWL